MNQQRCISSDRQQVTTEWKRKHKQRNKAVQKARNENVKLNRGNINRSINKA